MNRRYLYVIASEEDGPCKIGITANIRSRLSMLQTGSAGRLFEVWHFDDNNWFCTFSEKLAHHALREHRLTGEWFSVSPAVAIAEINGLILTIFRIESIEGVEKLEPDVSFGMLANGWATHASLQA